MSDERILPDEGRVLIELRVTFPKGHVIERRLLAVEYDLTIERDVVSWVYGARAVPGQERIRLNALTETEL